MKKMPLFRPLPPVIKQLMGFTAAGAVGFVVDVGTLRAAMSLAGLGFYGGRAASYLAAATVTWAINRCVTFRHARSQSLFGQWLRFVMANMTGGAVNYAVYAALVATLPLCQRFPELAVAAGSLSGLLVNFTASRRLVFRGA